MRTEIVYVATVNKDILDRELLYCAIPCVFKEKYIHGEVMSLRMDGLHKGLPGGYFDNALIMDICYNETNKHIHTKIFSTGKIQVCGVPNEKVFLDCVTIVCGMLNDAEKYIASMRDVDKKYFDKLLNESKGPEITRINTFELKGDLDLGTITLCQYVKETSIIWPYSDLPTEDVQTISSSMSSPELDIYKELKERCDDLLIDHSSPHSALKERVERLTSLTRKSRTYKLKNFKLCSVVLKYELGYVINRYALVTHLEKKGYTTYFANISGYGVTVYIPGVSDDRGEKLVFHPGGTIRHSGFSLDDMLKSKNNMLALLKTIENSIKLTI
jgi:hypothetical protein